MALLSNLDDLILKSGWPESLKDAGIVNSLAAGMCLLKAVNVMRTRYAYQVTTAVLDILRKKRLQWIPLFIQDLETLPKKTKADFEMGRFVNRSCHRSFSLPIDYAHEQKNKKIKGVWGSHWSHGKSSNVKEMDGSWPRTLQSN